MQAKDFRKDFPLLEQITYLDSATITLVPQSLLERMKSHYEEYAGIPQRGLHKLAIMANSTYEKCRKKIADFIGGVRENVVFCPNTAFGTGIGLSTIKFSPLDQIISSKTEHHSFILPIMQKSKSEGLKLKFLDAPSGKISLDSLDKALNEKVKLVALGHTSLATGILLDLKELSKIVHEHGAFLAIDASRTIGHFPINVREFDIDLLICNGSIGLFGPQGSGFVYTSDKIDHDKVLIAGAGSVIDVEPNFYSLEKFPHRYEPDTLNVIAQAIMTEGIHLIEKIGMEQIRHHEIKLIQRLIDNLETIENLKIFGPTKASIRAPIIGFKVKTINCHDIAMFLDEISSIAVRSGMLCAHMLMKELGTYKEGGVVQASTHFYNTREDIDQLVETLNEIVQTFS
ncbi:MAG: aminotransferase class V-fold PLP-dependent enzyme [Promethearchaeota archaeon]